MISKFRSDYIKLYKLFINSFKKNKFLICALFAKNSLLVKN